MMELRWIVAADNQGVIGFQNKLPFYLPDDLKYFRKLTSGGAVLMGKNTFLSIGKPLPHRTNIVLSRTLPPQPGIMVVRSLAEVETLNFSRIWVIGGQQIYHETQSDSRLSTIYLTHVHTRVRGDAFWDKTILRVWVLASSMYHPPDAKHPVGFSFQIWKKQPHRI